MCGGPAGGHQGNHHHRRKQDDEPDRQEVGGEADRDRRRGQAPCRGPARLAAPRGRKTTPSSPARRCSRPDRVRALWAPTSDVAMVATPDDAQGAQADPLGPWCVELLRKDSTSGLSSVRSACGASNAFPCLFAGDGGPPGIHSCTSRSEDRLRQVPVANLRGGGRAVQLISRTVGAYGILQPSGPGMSRGVGDSRAGSLEFGCRSVAVDGRTMGCPGVSPGGAHGQPNTAASVRTRPLAGAWRGSAQPAPGTGNSRTSKSDRIVGHSAAPVSEHDSVATAIGDP